MLYEILIRRKNTVLVPSSEVTIYKENSLPLVYSIVKNIEVKFGVTFDKEAVNILSCVPPDKIKHTFYNILIDALKKLYPLKLYNPFYVNFPKQVIDMKEVELYTNSVVHYTGDLIGKRMILNVEKEERSPFLEETEYKVLSVTTDENIINEIFDEIVNSKTSISKQDKADLNFLIKSFSDRLKLPEKFHYREIMVFVISELIKNGMFSPDYSKYFNTPTDLLRLAVALSNGDISLAEKSRFKSLSRKIRRFILSNLDRMDNQLSVMNDLHRHKSKWIKLTEKLHPGEYKDKYPKAFYYIDVLRNDKIRTYNSTIEFLIKHKTDNERLMYLLKLRPGDFARRIINLLDKVDNEKDGNDIIAHFNEVMDKVTTTTLFNIYCIIKYTEYQEYRSFLNKQGNFFVKENDRNVPYYYLARLITSIEFELLERFSKLEPLGNVYLDDKLMKYALPLSQRSASSSVETITRYSRLPIEKDNMRFFLYWKNIEDIRVDLDLSVSFFDKNWNLVSYVSYTNLVDDDLSVYHSGDLTSGPGSEYIDCNLSHLETKGVKYIIPTVQNYTNQPLENVPEASFGWMERENLEDGEIYEPLSVKNRVKLVSSKMFSLPCVIDLEQKEMVWCDLDLNHKQYTSAFFYPRERRCREYGINPQGNNVENNMNAIKAVGIGMIETKKPTIYDLLLFHTIARGKKVDNVDDADVVFSVEEKTHLNLSELMDDYLV